MLYDEIYTILQNVEDPFQRILGQEKPKFQLKSTLLMNHHVLIIGPPGVGKTTLVKGLASFLPEVEIKNTFFSGKRKGEERFIRIQGSPDLTVEDLIGDIDPIKALEHGPLSMEAFTPGKIFKAHQGILFFDEINRAPEKLQNALLQVLAEKKVTIGSYDVDIPAEFILIATMNPDDTTTETLSEVLLDRFDVVTMDYPEEKVTELQIIKQEGKKLDIGFDDKLFSNMVSFVRDMRTNDKLDKAPGVRATISLYERAQANALLRKKSNVDVDDIYDAALSVLMHRIKLKPSIEYTESVERFLQAALANFADDDGNREGDGL